MSAIARAPLLRSTAISTVLTSVSTLASTLALASVLAASLTLSALAETHPAKPKTPLPKPRPIARNAVPKSAPATTASTGTAKARETPKETSKETSKETTKVTASIPRAASAPATRQRAALPAAAQAGHARPRSPRRPRPRGPTWTRSKTSSSSIRKHNPADATQAEVRDHGSGRKEACRMDHPAQRRQRRLRRALPRVHRGQSELAVADLPAPAHGSGAVGRPSRRRRRVVVVRERIAGVGQRPIFAGARHARARRPRQCRAAGARSLAQRSDVGGHREHRARPVRRAADAGRPQGADGHAALRQRARGGVARGEAARRWLCRPRQGAHRLLQEGAQYQGRCSKPCRTSCTTIPATSSARSSCSAARRNSRKPAS